MALKIVQLVSGVRHMTTKATVSPLLFSRDLVKTNLQDMWRTNDVHVQASRSYVNSCAEEKHVSSYWGQSVPSMVSYFDSDAMENNYAVPQREIHADPYE
jgi:hypothetical protein